MHQDINSFILAGMFIVHSRKNLQSCIHEMNFLRYAEFWRIHSYCQLFLAKDLELTISRGEGDAYGQFEHFLWFQEEFSLGSKSVSRKLGKRLNRSSGRGNYLNAPKFYVRMSSQNSTPNVRYNLETVTNQLCILCYLTESAFNMAHQT